MMEREHLKKEHILVFVFSILLLMPFFPTVNGAENYVFITKWDDNFLTPGILSSPGGVVIDPSGNVYVSDSSNDRIQKFDSSGTYLAQWGSEGNGDGQFSWPSGIAIDIAGNVYVAEYGNHRIQKFSSTGTYLAQWGTAGSGDGEFTSPSGIAIDTAGNVYVADYDNPRIQKFSSTGTYLAQWGTAGSSDGQFLGPLGIAIDIAGNVYVTDNGNNRIQKFSSTGTYLAQWGTAGSGDGQFDGPFGVAVDNAGNFYVVDEANNRIQKFDSSGNFLTKWGSEGNGDGQFYMAGYAGIDAAGNVYVSDDTIDRIQKFDSSGTYLTQWGNPLTKNGGFDGPFGVSIDSAGKIYVADSYNNRIQKFDSSGNFLTKWGSEGSGDGQFLGPLGIAIDTAGNVYVADYDNTRIQKFSSTGTYLAQWGTSGSGDGQFLGPIDIAIDTAGNVYVADIDNNRIQKFDSSGNFLTKWGTAGSGDGEFYGPIGITIDSIGNVYVADYSNNRIQKFDSVGNFLTKWGTAGSGDGEFSLTRGVTVDAADKIYVADFGNNRIQKFDSVGNFLTKWGTAGSSDGAFDGPRGIAIDSEWNIYVVDEGNNRIQKFDSSGTFLAQWGNMIGAIPFDDPVGVTVDNTGDIYVVDSGNDVIQKFDSVGNFLTKWGTWGTGDGQFDNPIGVAVDDAGYIYVADASNNRIQKFDSSGTYLAQWGTEGSGDGQFFEPTGITIDSIGNVYVTDYDNYRIQKFDSSGTYLAQWGTEGSGDGQFLGLSGITSDSTGNIYVVEEGNNRIQKFDSSGTYLAQWGTAGSGDGEFSGPIGITIDSSGDIYVTDSGNNRIQKFDSSGTYLAQWGTAGSDNGQFHIPFSVAVDGAGYIYIADSGNSRIQKFLRQVISLPPIVTSISPASSTNTGTATITNLAGTGFQSGATVKLTKAGQTDITATNVVVVPPTKITCDFDLTGKSTGTWNVVVTNPDTQSGTLTGGFVVQVAAPGILWQKSLGGSSTDIATSVIQTSDSGYIVTGYSASNDGNVSGNHGISDYWIVKLDTGRNLVWQKSLGGSQSEATAENSVIQTSDGGYVVAGYSVSNDGNVSGNHGISDYWIVKLDTGGNLVWQKSLGGSDEDQAHSIIQTSDGGYVVAGFSASNDGNVTGNHGSYDYWIVKLDNGGNLVWQKSLGGSDDDRATSIVQTPDSGYVVSGHSRSNDGNVSGNHGGYDYWIVKLDNGGNLVWQKSLGGSSEDLAHSVIQTSDGGYIVAGRSVSSDGNVSGNHGSWDYWIVKLDTGGNLVWQKSLGGSGDDIATSVVQTPDNGYVITGYSLSNDGDVTGVHGSISNDYWIVKLDSGGNLVWQKALGGTEEEEAFSVTQTQDGGYVSAGFSSSSDGDVTGTRSSPDYWIVKIGEIPPTPTPTPTFPPPPPPSNPDGGNPDDSGGPAPASQPAPAPQQQPAQPPQQHPEPEPQQPPEPLAPLTPAEQPVQGLAGITVTESYPVGFEGLSFNADGQNSVSLDISAAEQAGATVTTYFDRVEVYQHGSPGVRITFFFDIYNQTAKVISGTAKGAEFETDPLTINVSAGKVAGSVHAVLNSISQPVKVENTITGNVTVSNSEQFRNILAQNNQSVTGFAYLMKFQRGELTSTGAANVTLTVPPSWVDQHGGKDAVRIGRISDSTGTTELIDTVFTGSDSGGNMVFRGDSPNGTSIFGLLTAKATAAKQIEEPNVTIQPLQKPAITTEIGMFAWLLGIFQHNPVVLVIVIAVIGVVAYFGWWKRRL